MNIDIYIFIGVIGVIIGSFCNVLIYRMPYNKDFIFSRSKCTKCNKQLLWWHNIPILSFILLKKKCYFCKENISYIYITVEILSSLIFLFVFNLFGFNIQALFASIIFILLLSLLVIDIYHKAVPESLLLFTLTLSFIYGIFSDNILVHFENMFYILSILYLLRLYVSFFKKQEAMGEGDIIIGAVMGALLGVELSFVAIFISSILALPFSL
jgi:leader peptidase (prepilin peptidase)/N-methyltransferase